MRINPLLKSKDSRYHSTENKITHDNILFIFIKGVDNIFKWGYNKREHDAQSTFKGNNTMTPQQLTEFINKEIDSRLQTIEHYETVLNKARMTNNDKKIWTCLMWIKHNTWIISLMKKHNITGEDALKIINQQSQ